jgi:hypothetical protein
LNWSSQEFQPQFKICLIHILPLNQGHGQKWTPAKVENWHLVSFKWLHLLGG